ncbi:hypothetical protein DFP72DRAFT_1078931 [Ephemerocybe angulata]|uniref:C2H2-type domain-containing protein n=1 Tax=Ephemerocybe angulata TaxID=980116 RepID=A0A8H6HBX4_9AGAR|nr:hypothetical protein DFP72DRAFT_1078931 [Tulosesus angulatus]
MSPPFQCIDCGKKYKTPGHFEKHQRSCKAGKRSFAEVLEVTKRLWEVKKKRRLDVERIQNDDEEMPVGEHIVAERLDVERIQDDEEMSVDEHIVSEAREVHENARQANSEPSLAQRKAPRAVGPPRRYCQPSDSEDSEDDNVRAVPGAAGSSSRSAVHPSGRHSQSSDSEDNNVRAVPGTAGSYLWLKPNDIRRLYPVPSKLDVNGIRRSYLIAGDQARLSHDPDPVLTIQDLIAAGIPLIATCAERPKEAPLLAGTSSYGPFQSKSAFEVAEWFWNSNSKSFLEFQKLMGIFKQPSFNLSEVVSTDWTQTFHSLGANKDDLSDSDGAWICDDGWKKAKISINVPFHHAMSRPGNISHQVGELHYRSIMSVIREKISNADDATQFHYAPYKATWKPNKSSPEVELYGEMYTSRAFREAHEEVQRLPNTKINSGLERVVVGLMFSSNATTLTHFCEASLWPCYLMFANESKYRRCEPNARLCYHVAYFQTVPNSFKDKLRERNGGKLPTENLFGFCDREVYQAQWSILLDEELRNAMKDGVVLMCPDNKERCFYPRILTHSADYPEKVSAAGLRQYGLLPCHRCHVSRWELSKLNSPLDTERESDQRSDSQQHGLMSQARKKIYDDKYAVAGKPMDDILKDKSLQPVESPFATLPIPQGFSISSALVVDLLHEFEIGVWKRLFIHLLRLLEAVGVAKSLSAELNARYRATPSFGRDGIRKFGVDASAMKRKATRDYEDLLQCAIPAFELLLPEPHNTRLMKLLYTCAQWHALAKLRLHNDLTLQLLDYTTTQLGAQMRTFERDTCSKYQTVELKTEADARARRQGSGNELGSSERRPAALGVFTIKFHYLGDYVSTIRYYGTTDSYSTEIGELAHRIPKQWYPRTDKRSFTGQISQIERRQARLARIRRDIQGSSSGSPTSHASGKFRSQATVDSSYHIAEDQNDVIYLNVEFTFDPDAPEDPYTTDFLPKLKQHILSRLLLKYGFLERDLPPNSWESIVLGDRLYRHKIAKFKYTSYDLREKIDVVHINTPQCNIMLLNGRCTVGSREHPYLYAKVLGIYHANVSFLGTLPDGSKLVPQRIDFLWVRWFDQVQEGSPEFTLDHVNLSPLDVADSIQFVNPMDVLRGVHIIPRFTKGLMKHQDPKSSWIKDEKLWTEYAVNRFADRDLFMRYQYGMSVGHAYMRDDFPVSKIPSIPQDFDFCILPSTKPPPKAPKGKGRAKATEIPPGDHPSEVVSLNIPAPAPTPASAPSAHIQAPNTASSSRQQIRTPSTHQLTNADVDSEDSDREVDGAEDGEEYLDDMDDEEITACEEMYAQELMDEY